MQTLENWYQEQTAKKALEFDSAQLSILQQLDNFIHKFNQQSFISRWFNKPKYLGYYIYGSVGRGKSMIMNELYRIFPDSAKTRIHFHEFMYDIQQQLQSLKAHDNPLEIVAKKIKKQFKIIFLDEMLVNDIASAMILNNLFKSLFEQNIYIITSSNSKPDDLYRDGLMRDRFLPAIELLNNQLEVVSLDSPNDYRLLHSSSNNLFIIQQPDANSLLDKIFNSINANINKDTSILIHARQIPVIQKSSNIIWFDFNIICGDKRSQLDYLELVKHFEWFIISDIHSINDKNKDVARRFTWLIDILYDNQAKLAISTDVGLEQIYPSGDLIDEFARTVSRLKEMRTKEYINKTPLTSNIKDLKNVR
jgi:cell division protein ZapE